MRTGAIGYGSGMRDLPDLANVLRVLVGYLDEATGYTEAITVVEATIDDMNPELFPPLMEDLLGAGARDVFLTPVLGKKGRPAHVLTVLCDGPRLHDCVALLFQGSSTLGVRMREERRVCLDRTWRKARTPWGPVRVKLGRHGEGAGNAAPEFEDCRALAGQAQVPVRRVYLEALASAVRGEWDDDD